MQLVASTTTPSRPGAVAQSDRIVPIDVLRGFALLGILVMNIQSFAMIGMAYINPYGYGDMTGANYWVWYLSHIFADQKFMTIFSMLFGAGIVLMTGRQEAATGRSAKVHYKRMAILLGFGLIHAYLIWYGDILVCYALCGMLVYLFRRFRPLWLIVIGLSLISIHTGLYCAFYQWIQQAPAADVEEIRRGMSQSSQRIEQELAAYRGPWLGQFSHRPIAAVMFQTMLFALWSFWRASGLMLIGMALYKLDVLSGRRSTRVYFAMLIVGLIVGIPVILTGKQKIDAHQWDMIYTMFAGLEFNYWGSLFVSLAYVGLVMLICQLTSLKRLTLPLAAVGQMALTNYLLQSILATFIFYGHGLGYFGHVNRVGQLGIVLCICVLQLVVSPIWLKYFRFGPAEWLWRALTYAARPAMRRRNEIGSTELN